MTRSFCAKYNLHLRYHSAVAFNDKMCIMVCFMTFLSSVLYSAHPIFSPLHVFSMPCLRKKPPQLCHADIYFCLVKLPKCCGIFENSLYHLWYKNQHGEGNMRPLQEAYDEAVDRQLKRFNWWGKKGLITLDVTQPTQSKQIWTCQRPLTSLLEYRSY